MNEEVKNEEETKVDETATDKTATEVAEEAKKEAPATEEGSNDDIE